MKNASKLFAFLSVALFALSGFCVSVNAPLLSNGLLFESKNDGKTAWITKITNANGSPLGRQQVIVPSEIAGLPVTDINANVFARSAVSEVILPDTITKLCLGQFSKCAFLERVVIGSGLIEIPYQCFNKCTSLKTVEISPNSHLEKINNEAFYNCSRLTHINFPPSLTKIGYDSFKNTPILPPAHLIH